MCIFCKIVDGSIPSERVMEDDDFLAFRDVNPVAKVHILAIPKKHVDCFQNMPAEMMGRMGTFIQNVAKQEGLDESGYRLITNNGDDGGQEVKHLHFHILGGEKLKW